MDSYLFYDNSRLILQLAFVSLPGFTRISDIAGVQGLEFLGKDCQFMP
jgi:hypothetical protein